MSFALQDLIGTAREEMPRWLWLLSKTQGLSRFKPVEHALAGVSNAESLLVIFGRDPQLPNAHVRFEYTCVMAALKRAGLLRSTAITSSSRASMPTAQPTSTKRMG